LSRENVEIVRAIYEDWLLGEPALDRFDPEMSMVESKTLPGAAAAHGIDEVRRYLESFARYWDEIRFDPTEYLEVGHQVVVVARLVGQGKASGVAVERTWAYVWAFRGGKALSMTGYATREEALEAARLSE
jgi:ketosteroid isomerase-like protein